MGRDVDLHQFSRDDRRRYREKITLCLDVLDRMLRESRFDVERPMSGLEIELNLVNDAYLPAMANARALEAIADPAFQTELGQFNIEINVPPRPLGGGGCAAFERDVRASLNAADEKTRALGVGIVMVGILPTIAPDHLDESTMSPNPRFALMNEQIFAARGEDIHIAIDGIERIDTYADTVAPEAACTSTQFHLQVSPDEFASYWNASQAIAGVQVALGANAPFFFGRELWRETRIALFEQATDARPVELKAQGVRPRVWFGERWITSIFDLFEENVRYFPSLLPVCDEEDPVAVLDAGGTPHLHELTLHNGTIYRWNRPVYAVVDDRPHLRVENRVLPAGPTVVDMIANQAFHAGLTRALAEEERPLWTRMSFGAAAENLDIGARDGIDARLYWPGVGQVPVTELVVRKLLPLAAAGLDRWGVEPAERDRLLGVIEGRCVRHRNGASWQAETFHALVDGGMARDAALAEMLHRYCEHMHTNTPVHDWP